jgi:hypothetical protein
MALLVLSKSTPAGVERRPGRVTKDETTTVTLDDDGRPVVGGSSKLEMRRTKKGVLLAIRVEHPGTEMTASSPRFLAYSSDPGMMPKLLVLAQPGPGCFWKQEHFHEGTDPCGPIVDIDYFVVPDGPFVGFELGLKGRYLALMKDRFNTNRYGPYIGRKIEREIGRAVQIATGPLVDRGSRPMEL